MGSRSRHLFCPYDATPLDLSLAGAAEKVGGRCPRCGYVDYLNPRPCVGFFVYEAGQILLARRGVEPAKGEWDIPGGFIDCGETARHAVRREARQETTLRVKAGKCLGSIPDVYGEREYPTLNFIYLARYVYGEPKPKDDVTELRWFPIDALPKLAFPHQAEAVRLLRRHLGLADR